MPFGVACQNVSSAFRGTISSRRPSSRNSVAVPRPAEVAERVDAAEVAPDRRAERWAGRAPYTPRRARRLQTSARSRGAAARRRRGSRRCAQPELQPTNPMRAGSTSGRCASRSTARRTATTSRAWICACQRRNGTPLSPARLGHRRRRRRDHERDRPAGREPRRRDDELLPVTARAVEVDDRGERPRAPAGARGRRRCGRGRRCRTRRRRRSGSRRSPAPGRRIRAASSRRRRTEWEQRRAHAPSRRSLRRRRSA